MTEQVMNFAGDALMLYWIEAESGDAAVGLADQSDRGER